MSARCGCGLRGAMIGRGLRVYFLFFLLFYNGLWPSFFLNAQTPAQEAESDPLAIFEKVKPDRSLQTSPEFLLIDDFNEGRMTNRRGALWRTKTPVPGALDLSISKGDARNPDRGSSLAAQFNLKSKEAVSLQSFLNRLDVSAASHLVFKCRIKTKENNFSGRLRVALTDWRQKTVVHDFTPSCGEEWGDAIISLRAFKDLDLNQLHLIEFMISAKTAESRGDLGIDEIAFFGFNDVAFESNRDNLIGYPKVISNEARRTELIKEKKDKEMLLGIARDTWKYFENARDRETYLIVDHIRMGDGSLASDYTSPTNIAMDILSLIAASDLEFISREESLERVQKVIASLEKLRRFEGFFYNFYDTKKMNVTRSYISAVDSGWLAIALVVARQAFPEQLQGRITQLLDSFSFSEFLDYENNQFVIGFDVPRKGFGEYHYGMLVSEARATSYYAIGKGDVPKSHWGFLFRTPPESWKWQKQKPKGKQVAGKETDYFQGYYEYKGKKFVPSWGGSLFEYLMPTLVLQERELAKRGLGLNNRIATELQRDYALKEKHYPVWGISPASVGSGRSWKYEEFGISELGAKGYRDREIVTPHVSFLALDSLPSDAIKNIRNLLKFEGLYGEYGFYDAVNVRNRKANPQYLALDQGMSFVALCNYLKNGSIQKRFHADPIGKAGEALLDEKFF